MQKTFESWLQLPLMLLDKFLMMTSVGTRALSTVIEMMDLLVAFGMDMHLVGIHSM